jgi:hypothetical protein
MEEEIKSRIKKLARKYEKDIVKFAQKMFRHRVFQQKRENSLNL